MLDFNRSRTRTQNLYAFSNDITGDAGNHRSLHRIHSTGACRIFPLRISPAFRTRIRSSARPQTYTFSDNVVWNHGKHTWRWGGDFRRVQLNTEATATRAARSSSPASTLATDRRAARWPARDTTLPIFCSDCRSKLPSSSAGNNYFHGNYWDLYAQDEWKMRGNLTLNLGVRYEYVSPLTELNNRIANLDLSPGVLNADAGHGGR